MGDLSVIMARVSGNRILSKIYFLGSNTGSIELLETEAQDVDTLVDWKMLKIKY